MAFRATCRLYLGMRTIVAHRSLMAMPRLRRDLGGSTIRVGIPLTSLFSVDAVQIMMHAPRLKETAVKFRDPWIDPRITQLGPAEAKACPVRRGW